MIIKTDAIVIRSTKYSDSDLILTLFTQKLGKVSCFAKNARKMKSPLMASSQIFAYSSVNLSTKDGRFLLANTDMEHSFYKLTSKVEKTYLGYYMVEFVDKVTFENQTNFKLFQLLKDSLITLETNDNVLLQKITFELKLLAFTGYKPSIGRCISCGETKELGNFFSVADGGRVCSKCLKDYPSSKQYDSTTYRLMDYILNNSTQKVVEAQISEIILNELNELVDKYIQYQLSEIRLKTKDFLIL